MGSCTSQDSSPPPATDPQVHQSSLATYSYYSVYSHFDGSPSSSPAPDDAYDTVADLDHAPIPATRAPIGSITNHRALATASSRDQASPAVIAAAINAPEEELHVDLNAAFQSAYDTSPTTPLQASSRQAQLVSIIARFNSTASKLGLFVASMLLDVPPSMHLLVPTGKGAAGGIKYVVGRFLVKVPEATGAAAAIYKGNSSLVRKAVGCELRAAQAVLDLNVDGAHLALVCTVEHRGVLVVVQSLLPLDGDVTLSVGSADGGRTVHADSPTMLQVCARIGAALHLKKHRICRSDVELYLAGDVEAHLGKDGRGYIIDFGRLLPPTRGYGAAPKRVPYPLVHQFRPEFMVDYPTRLSPDGFCGWGLHNYREHNCELRAAWTHILDTLVPKAARELTSLDPGTLLLVQRDQPRPLAQFFHARGLNMRLLLWVRKSVPAGHESVRDVLLLEAAWRSVKFLLRAALRSGRPTPETAMRKLLDDDVARPEFWRDELSMVVRRLFVEHLPAGFLADGTLEADLQRVAATAPVALRDSLRKGLPSVVYNEDTQDWEFAATTTMLRAAQTMDVAAAAQRLRTEIEVRSESKGEFSVEVMQLQLDMLALYRNWVDTSPERTLALSGELIDAIMATAGASAGRAWAVHACADFWRHVGEYDKARPLFEQCLRVQEDELGAEHEEVATTCNHLARLFENQGKLDDARPLYDRALHVTETALGKEHLQVADVCNNLAGLLKKQKRYDDARPLYARALRIREAQLGQEHPKVAQTCMTSGELLTKLGEFDQAKLLLERAVRIDEATQGADNMYVGVGYYKLAGFYHATGELQRATECCEHALGILQKKLPAGHRRIREAQERLQKIQVALLGE